MRYAAKWLYFDCPTCKEKAGYYCVGYTRRLPKTLSAPHAARKKRVEEPQHGNK